MADSPLALRALKNALPGFVSNAKEVTFHFLPPFFSKVAIIFLISMFIMNFVQKKLLFGRYSVFLCILTTLAFSLRIAENN